jgi:hypothetical protein
MRCFGIPPGCSCGLHSSGILRGTTSKKSECRKSASLHYFRLREAASVGGYTGSWNEVYSITKITVYSRLSFMWICSIQYSDCLLLLTPFGQGGESCHYWPRNCMVSFSAIFSWIVAEIILR